MLRAEGESFPGEEGFLGGQRGVKWGMVYFGGKETWSFLKKIEKNLGL